MTHWRHWKSIAKIAKRIYGGLLSTRLAIVVYRDFFACFTSDSTNCKFNISLSLLLFSQHFSMNNGFLIKLELANEVSWFRIQPTSRVWNFQKSCNTESRVLIKSLPLVSSLGNSFIHSRLHFLKLPLAHRQAFDVNERTFFTYQWMNEWKMQIQLCKSTFSHRESLLISFWNLDHGNFAENGRIFITKCVF